MTARRARRALLVLAVSLASRDVRVAQAQAGPPTQPAPAAVRPGEVVDVIKSQHLRIPFTRDIQRVASGDPDTLSFEIINSRELLVLGRSTGRTTLVVWFTDGTVQQFVFSVHRELSVLQDALTLIHPSIRIESAPDRDALVLTGVVPDITFAERAEAVAQMYLNAGRQSAANQPFFGTPSSAAPPAPPLEPAAGAAAAPGQPPAPQGQGPVTVTVGAPAQPPPPVGSVINLIQVDTLPPLPEQKISAAIQSIGGRGVTIRRVVKGNVRNDAVDTLVLEGTVPNQVALVRVLEIAAQIFANQAVNDQNIRVIADEAGGLAGRTGQGGGGGGGGGGGSSFGAGGSSLGLSSGSRGARLMNDIQRNVARAKAIDVANGRILSFIEVGDLPQVRVAIRLLEVNRSRLRSFNPESALLVSNFRQPSLNPAGAATVVQGDQAARVGSASRTALQDVLAFLGGALTNEFQLSSAHAAVDLAVTLLERQGVVRTLSSPALTVLSGEIAQFQVGGEIPITIGLAPVFGTAAITVQQGAFTAVDFVAFGIQLGIRPLVGDDDTITLDVQPQVVLPDATLTDVIRQTSGTNPQTTAFQTRALRTSSRLQDGQTLLIGGLRTDTLSRNTARTPGLADVPALGWLFKNFNRNDETVNLVVVVNPVIVRTRVPDAPLWAWPNGTELLQSIGRRNP